MDKILVDSGLLSDIADYSMNEGTQFSLAPSGMSSGRGFKDTDRLTYFTFVGDIFQGRDGDYNKNLLLIERCSDEKTFGVVYLAPVIEDRLHDKRFNGELTEMREIEVTETVTVHRTYEFAE